MTGLVIRSTGSWYDVRTGSGEIVPCRIRGKFRTKGLKTTNPVAVGDKVEFEKEPGLESGWIKKIIQRENYLIRQSPRHKYKKHILGANIDLAALVATISHPVTSFGFIDRFLLTAEVFHIPAVLLVNKCDLYNKSPELQELTSLYKNTGYRVLSLSAKTGDGIEGLKKLINKNTSLFAGHSGSGKSTLINKLCPGLDIKTSEVSDMTGKGVHTTTNAALYEIPSGGAVIDTPGVKEWGITDAEPEEISGYFPEMNKKREFCRFNNCLHINEPGCAVKEAVGSGEIKGSRYDSYRSILDELNEWEHWERS